MNCLTLLAHCHRTGTLLRISSNASHSNTNSTHTTRSTTHPYAYANVTRVQNVMEASLYDRSPVRTVITPEAMHELLDNATSIYASNALHEDEDTSICCPITQSEFAAGDAVLTLPCGHTFMQDAIQTWLEKERAECPVCRHALPSHEVIINR